MKRTKTTPPRKSRQSKTSSQSKKSPKKSPQSKTSPKKSPRTKEKGCYDLIDETSCNLNTRCSWKNKKCISVLFDKLDIDPVDLKMKDTEKVLAYYEFLKTKNERSGDENMDFEVLSKMVVSDKKVDEIVELIDNFSEEIDKIDNKNEELKASWFYKIGYYSLLWDSVGIISLAATGKGFFLPYLNRRHVIITIGMYLYYQYRNYDKQKTIFNKVVSREEMKKFIVKQFYLIFNMFLYTTGGVVTALSALIAFILL